MFTWKETYTVNQQEIDNQHKKLFEMGRSMESLVNESTGDDIYDELNAMFEELVDYTIYHFDAEEKIMADANYVNLEKHKKEHTNFIDKLNSLELRDMEDNQEAFALQMLKTVATWIFKHIVGQDFLYKGLI